ncbi:NDP-sugar synthase [Thermodesulfobacteriota bacterium]
MTAENDLKVLILCGGKGERLKPLTESLPKPLVKIKGRPILSYLLTHFKSYGLEKFVIAVGYKARRMVEYFEKEHQSLQIEIVDSGDVNIVKRIKDAATCLTDDFIVSYGDTLADVNLNDLIQFHHSHSGGVTITCFPLQSQFGILETDGNDRVTSFVEKPVLDKWINIGYFYFDRCMIDQVMAHRSFVDFLKDVAQSGNLYCYRHRGVHITVNTIQELGEAENNIAFFENNISGKNL